jgi:hypothetical protein
MLRALTRLGCQRPPDGLFTTVLVDEGYSCTVPVLAWMLQAGCRVPWPAALAAVEGTKALSPVVKAWLLEQSARQPENP